MKKIVNHAAVLAMAGLLALSDGAAAGFDPGHIAARAAAVVDSRNADIEVAAQVTDVTGDGIPDAISLIGASDPTGGRFINHMRIIVTNGATQQPISAELVNFGGYDAKLFAGDFDGDKIADIMISAPTGGSGGIIANRILSFADGTAKVIFDADNNRGVRFTGEFLDGYQVSLLNTDTNRVLLLDESSRQENYRQIGLYDRDGKVLQPRAPFIDPFGRLDPVDTDGDGTYELRGVQRISGAYHADGIAEVLSLWKHGAGGWSLQRVELTPLPKDGAGPVLLYHDGEPDNNCIRQSENVTI